MRALVGAHQRKRLLGNGAHRLHVLVEPQVQHGSHVEASNRRVRVPGAARPVALEELREAIGVFGKVLERDGAILDEGHGLTRFPHRHHDIQSRGAQVGDRSLQRGFEHVDHAAVMRAGSIP